MLLHLITLIPERFNRIIVNYVATYCRLDALSFMIYPLDRRDTSWRLERINEDEKVPKMHLYIHIVSMCAPWSLPTRIDVSRAYRTTAYLTVPLTHRFSRSKTQCLIRWPSKGSGKECWIHNVSLSFSVNSCHVLYMYPHILFFEARHRRSSHTKWYWRSLI